MPLDNKRISDDSLTTVLSQAEIYQQDNRRMSSYPSILADVIKQLTSRHILHNHEKICRGAYDLVPDNNNNNKNNKKKKMLYYNELLIHLLVDFTFYLLFSPFILKN